MEEVKIKAQELSRLVHEVKAVNHDMIRRIKMIHDEIVPVCEILIKRAYELSDEVDKIVSDIEVKG